MEIVSKNELQMKKRLIYKYGCVNYKSCSFSKICFWSAKVCLNFANKLYMFSIRCEYKVIALILSMFTQSF